MRISQRDGVRAGRDLEGVSSLCTKCQIIQVSQRTVDTWSSLYSNRVQFARHPISAGFVLLCLCALQCSVSLFAWVAKRPCALGPPCTSTPDPP